MELKDRLRLRKLPISGKKDDLVGRLSGLITEEVTAAYALLPNPARASTGPHAPPHTSTYHPPPHPPITSYSPIS